MKILRRSGKKENALAGDIENSFLNIGVHEHYRDALRLILVDGGVVVLWVDSLGMEDPELVLDRFCSQYSSDVEFVRKLLNSLYMYDLVSGEGDLKKCLALPKVKEVLLRRAVLASMQMVSNSPKLLASIRRDRKKAEGDCSEQIVEATETCARTTEGHLEELYMKNEH